MRIEDTNETPPPPPVLEQPEPEARSKNFGKNADGHVVWGDWGWGKPPKVGDSLHVYCKNMTAVERVVKILWHDRRCTIVLANIRTAHLVEPLGMTSSVPLFAWCAALVGPPVLTRAVYSPCPKCLREAIPGSECYPGRRPSSAWGRDLYDDAWPRHPQREPLAIIETQYQP